MEKTMEKQDGKTMENNGKLENEKLMENNGFFGTSWKNVGKYWKTFGKHLEHFGEHWKTLEKLKKVWKN